MSPDEWERRRSALVQRIPAGYSPAVHLGALTLLSFTLLLGSLFFVRQAGPVHLLTVLATTLFSLGFEWWVHRFILHRRMPGVSRLYERHEREHHLAFTADALELRDKRELRLVLMPAYTVLLVFVILLPLVALVNFLVSRNDALIAMATVMFLLPTYEWMHAAYHLPQSSPIFRIPGLPWLREHHRLHHAPRLMNRWNFNVIVPIFDGLLGTRWSARYPLESQAPASPPIPNARQDVNTVGD